MLCPCAEPVLTAVALQSISKLTLFFFEIACPLRGLCCPHNRSRFQPLQLFPALGVRTFPSLSEGSHRPPPEPPQGLGVQGCNAQGVGPAVAEWSQGKGLLQVSRLGSGCVLGARSWCLMSPSEGPRRAELPESWATQVSGQGARLGHLMEGLGRTGGLEFSL